VFVDESGTHISMDRLRSRAPKGDRAYGKVPKNRGKNMTLIASMSLYGMGESMCVLREPPMPRPSRPTWSTPWRLRLARGAGSGDGQPRGAPPQEDKRIDRSQRSRELVFVPSYSPDLNPIEQAFSKINNVLRKLGARTHETLLEAMEEALSKVTPADAAGWFGHCGYQVEVQYL
jgi:hypothetical protein